MKYIIILLFFTLLVNHACTNSVNRKDKEFKKSEKKKKNKSSSKKDIIRFSEGKENLKSFEKGKIENTKFLDNGIVIKGIVNGATRW